MTQLQSRCRSCACPTTTDCRAASPSQECGYFISRSEYFRRQTTAAERALNQTYVVAIALLLCVTTAGLLATLAA